MQLPTVNPKQFLDNKIASYHYFDFPEDGEKINGMILGVPLAVIMKILLESDERTLPIAIMLSRNPPLPVDNNNEVSISRDSE